MFKLRLQTFRPLDHETKQTYFSRNLLDYSAPIAWAFRLHMLFPNLQCWCVPGRSNLLLSYWQVTFRNLSSIILGIRKFSNIKLRKKFNFPEFWPTVDIFIKFQVFYCYVFTGLSIPSIKFLEYVMCGQISFKTFA